MFNNPDLSVTFGFSTFGIVNNYCSKEVNTTKLAEPVGAIGQALLRKELLVGVDHNHEQVHYPNVLMKQRTKGGNRGFEKQKQARE